MNKKEADAAYIVSLNLQKNQLEKIIARQSKLNIDLTELRRSLSNINKILGGL